MHALFSLLILGWQHSYEQLGHEVWLPKGIMKAVPQGSTPFNYIAAVGEFKSHQTFTKYTKLGEPLNLACPQHGPSFGVTFAWTSKKARSIQFPINNRVAIDPSTGNLHIMYITQEDVSTFNNLEGIRCTVSAANTFYTSGTLTLQILPGDDWFLLLYCFIIIHLVKGLAVLVTLPQLRTLWYFSQHPSGFLFCHIL